MDGKACCKCKIFKSLNDFHSHKKGPLGKQRWCKACAKEYNQSEKGRISTKKYRGSYKGKETRLKYIHTESGKSSKKNSRDKYRSNNKIKIEAHQAATRAIKAGDLIRSYCENCDHTPSESHHDDYAKPLEVRWLCRSCHNDWHSINGSGLNG